jgi:hypothetical protein
VVGGYEGVGDRDLLEAGERVDDRVVVSEGRGLGVQSSLKLQVVIEGTPWSRG